MLKANHKFSIQVENPSGIWAILSPFFSLKKTRKRVYSFGLSYRFDTRKKNHTQQASNDSSKLLAATITINSRIQFDSYFGWLRKSIKNILEFVKIKLNKSDPHQWHRWKWNQDLSQCVPIRWRERESHTHTHSRVPIHRTIHFNVPQPFYRFVLSFQYCCCLHGY